MTRLICPVVLTAALFLGACNRTHQEVRAEAESLKACGEALKRGFLPIAETRERRFSGKVEEDTARCRGGEMAVRWRAMPWVDWANYWGTGDAASKGPSFSS